MLIQILTHTPLYVWAILAFLLWRGLVEMRDRNVAPGRMFVLPLAMLALSLHDMTRKFDLGAMLVGAWVAGCVLAALLAWRFGPARIGAGTTPDRVRIRGSASALVLMLAIFLTKYATSVMMVVQPTLVHRFAPAICLVFGLFNGFFLGRLARDVAAWRKLADARAPKTGALIQS
jgi:hypothetical protein